MRIYIYIKRSDGIDGTTLNDDRSPLDDSSLNSNNRAIYEILTWDRRIARGSPKFNRVPTLSPSLFRPLEIDTDRQPISIYF